jgi:hypothetical protein
LVGRPNEFVRKDIGNNAEREYWRIFSWMSLKPPKIKTTTNLSQSQTVLGDVSEAVAG